MKQHVVLEFKTSCSQSCALTTYPQLFYISCQICHHLFFLYLALLHSTMALYLDNYSVTGSSKFSGLRSLIFHANFLDSNVFMPVTDKLNEIIIHHLQFNVVNLISTRHMMDQEPLKTTPSKIHFANSNIFPHG